MPAYLYRTEAKGIQAFVLGTRRLNEIAGGSEIVAGLASAAMALLDAGPGGHAVLQQAAGGLTIRFADEAGLSAFADWWPLVVARRAPGLTVLQAWRPLADDADLGSTLQALLSEDLPQARNRPALQLPEAGPLAARAARTGRPAVARAQDNGGGFVDAATQARTGARKPAAETLWTRLFDGTGETRTFLADHNAFPESDIAVLHIDGNDVGRRVRTQARSPAAYQAFSTALAAATLRAARAAVHEGVRSLDDSRTGKRDWTPEQILLRPVVVGGDDVTLLVPAREALRVVECFLAAFERETAAEPAIGGALTAAAGVAFVKKTHPFHAALDLAEALCAWTKSQLRQDDGPTPSACTFHLTAASLGDSWAQVQATSLAAATRAGPPQPGGLTAAPYRLHAAGSAPTLAGLQTLVHGVKKHSGALREWARQAQVDRAEADRLWARAAQVARRKGAAPDPAWDALVAALAGLGATEGSPWRPPDAGGTTPLYDALVLKSLQVVDFAGSADRLERP